MVVRRYSEKRPAESSPAPRRGRPPLRLFLPSLALGAVFLAVAAFWAYASWRTRAEIDSWLAAEAGHGRTWSCPDRVVGGFPFRIEVSCANPTFSGRAEGRDVTGGLAGIKAVAQVYNPNHVIVEAAGPLTVRDAGGGELAVDWQLLQASVTARAAQSLERFSIVLTEPRARLLAPGLAETRVAAESADLHVRPTPDAKSPGSFDLASRLTKASIPPLDAVFGRGETTDTDLLATITQADVLRGAGLPDELDRWREAGGKVDLTKLVVARGARRLDATGVLRLDDARRASGRVDVTLSGLDDLLQSLGLGPRTAAIGNLIAGVLGGGKAKPPPEAEGDPGSAPRGGLMLPLRLENGKAMLGPVRVATLLPLY